ncbi:IclR family transcriptional regulator [Actinomycetota bacterium Odt1-20B]
MARPTGGRGVLEGAFALLDALEETEEAGLSALATAAGLPKTTAYRLLEQLAELGAVEHRDCRYRVGPRVFRLGQGWQPHPRLRPAAAGPMRRLAAATEATVGLCVLSEGRTLAAMGIPGMVNELAPLRPGATWPWTTAAGKLLVATAPPTLPLDPLPALWPREARTIRDAQVALDREDLIAGVSCVATPVTTAHHQVVGALCAMVTPAYDITKLTQAVQQTARAISTGLRRR